MSSAGEIPSAQHPFNTRHRSSYSFLRLARHFRTLKNRETVLNSTYLPVLLDSRRTLAAHHRKRVLLAMRMSLRKTGGRAGIRNSPSISPFLLPLQRRLLANCYPPHLNQRTLYCRPVRPSFVQGARWLELCKSYRACSVPPHEPAKVSWNAIDQPKLGTLSRMAFTHSIELTAPF